MPSLITIPTLPAAPAPAASLHAAAQGQQANDQASTFAQQQSAGNAQATPAASAKTSGNNTSGGSGSRDTNQFGKLLVAKSVPAASAPDTQAAVKAAAPIAENDDTDGITSDAVAELMAMLLQLQQIQQNPVSKEAVADLSGLIKEALPAGTSLPSDDTTQPSDANDAALQDLLTLINQLLAQPQQQPAASQDAAPAFQAEDQAGNASDDSSLSALASLLQALLPQQPHSPATDVTAINPDASAAIKTDLAAALTKLAALLEEKPAQASTGNVAQAVPAETAVVAVPKQAALADGQDAAPMPDPQNTTDTAAAPPAFNHQLKQALERAVDALTTKPGDKAGSLADVSKDTDTPATVITQPAPQPQPSQATEFVKHLQQATPHTPVQDQVLVHIRNAVSDGLSQIRVQLHPEDLGKVDVQITTTADGKTGITITADNRNTLALLQNEARSLQDALRDIGLKADAGSMNFNLRDQQQDARNSSKQPQGGYTKVAAVGENDDFGFSTAGALYRMSVQQGLDIRV